MRDRVDANQSQIVEVLKKQGATVVPLNSIKRGVPDILVGFNGKNILVEIKDGKKPPSARKLTPDQEEFHRDWKGVVKVITSVEEALSLLQ